MLLNIVSQKVTQPAARRPLRGGPQNQKKKPTKQTHRITPAHNQKTKPTNPQQPPPPPPPKPEKTTTNKNDSNSNDKPPNKRNNGPALRRPKQHRGIFEDPLERFVARQKFKPTAASFAPFEYKSREELARQKLERQAQGQTPTTTTTPTTPTATTTPTQTTTTTTTTTQPQTTPTPTTKTAPTTPQAKFTPKKYNNNNNNNSSSSNNNNNNSNDNNNNKHTTPNHNNPKSTTTPTTPNHSNTNKTTTSTTPNHDSKSKPNTNNNNFTKNNNNTNNNFTKNNFTKNNNNNNNNTDDNNNNNSESNTKQLQQQQQRYVKKLTDMFNEKQERPFVPLNANQLSVPENSNTFSTELFSDLEIDPRLKAALELMELERMTKIQQVAIPNILSGDDILLKSPTGSGKTLCYLVPLVAKLLKSRIERTQGTQGIVIVPTRELCVQVCGILQKLTKTAHYLVSGPLMGGEKKHSEKNRLRKGVSIIVATPGRLLDHLSNTAAFNLTNLSVMVLDEADRVLDMGYGEAVRQIVNQLKTKCDTETLQTVLISATIREDVNKLADISLKNKRFISADDIPGFSMPNSDPNSSHASSSAVARVPENLLQMWTTVPAKRKLVTLLAFLSVKTRAKTPFKSIVFVSTCDCVEFFFRFLHGVKWPKALQEEILKEDSTTTAENTLDPQSLTLPLIRSQVFQLHGNMTQQKRTEVYRQFCSCGEGVLLCTSVAARGLDLPAVDWIVQYDPASDVDEYVHRVGRTARLGRRGHSLLFLAPTEKQFVNELTKQKLEVVELSLDSIHTKFCPNRTQHRLTVLQKHLEETIVKHDELHILSVNAFRAFVRSYAAYPREMKHIFHPKKLHLGHVAKSFALKEAPTHMMKFDTIERKKRKFEGANHGDERSQNQSGRGGGGYSANKRQRLMGDHAFKQAAMEFG